MYHSCRGLSRADFTGVLQHEGVAISMDGKGRAIDNIFVERLWRSLKYEDVYLHDYTTLADAQAGIAKWIRFYNERRPHQTLDNRTPMEVYRGRRSNGRPLESASNAGRP